MKSNPGKGPKNEVRRSFAKDKMEEASKNKPSRRLKSSQKYRPGNK